MSVHGWVRARFGRICLVVEMMLFDLPQSDHEEVNVAPARLREPGLELLPGLGAVGGYGERS